MSQLAVCIAAGSPPTWQLLRSIVGLRGPGDGGYILTLAEGLGVGEARNLLVEKFLASKADWLLFVDRDAVVHPLTALRLMSWNEPIVSALAFTRSEPPSPTIYAGAGVRDDGGIIGYRTQIEETREWIRAHPELHTNHPALISPRPDDALRQVDFTGMHCTLIRRDVLETVQRPWFQRVHPVGGPKGAGEDYWFCRHAAEKGFSMFVDRSVQAGHICEGLSMGSLAFMAWDAICDWEHGGYDFGIRGAGYAAA